MEPFRSHTGILTHRPSRGVTLIELLVVLAIITILMAVVVTSQSSFNKTLLLSNTAYDVALTIRTAETFGIGNRPGSGTFFENRGYGVHFDTMSTNSFKMFADITPPATSGSCHPIPAGRERSPDIIPGNCAYTPGASSDDSSGETKVFTLGNGMQITRLRVKIASGWVPSTITALDIVFARPNTKIFIAYTTSGTQAVYNASATEAEIELRSPQGGDPRYICVGLSGSIRVNGKNQCP